MLLKELFDYQEISETGQKFFQKGANPKLLIVSGTHGDEYEIVPLVEAAVFKYRDQLPDFLYVPQVSPSALALRTRKNKDEIDVNRGFVIPPVSLEVKKLMELWEKYNFEIFLTFHEDPQFLDFYLYDGETAENYAKYRLDDKEPFRLLQQDLLAAGINLYTGVDDPEDPKLGYQVTNGYAHWGMIVNDHSADYWLLIDTGRAKQVINPEIPGKLSLGLKEKIIEVIFERLIVGDQY